MQILVVKMSSLGDVIHTLPAITEAKHKKPDLSVDWVVEEAFQEIPTWHPAVSEVIVVPLRRWRRQPWKMVQEARKIWDLLSGKSYDKIIDAQGLLKSALLTCVPTGRRFGFHWHSAREKLASLFYQETVSVPREEQAIWRQRQLFARVLGYTPEKHWEEYGIDTKQFERPPYGDNTLLFLHGTTWQTKQWPLAYWQALAERLQKEGFQVLLPWGNTEEYIRACQIQASCARKLPRPQVLPPLSLRAVAGLLLRVRGVVALDTGLSHLAAAFQVPMVSLYGATHPEWTGTGGQSVCLHAHLQFSCAPCLSKRCRMRVEKREESPPCLQALTPETVWQRLRVQLERPR